MIFLAISKEDLPVGCDTYAPSLFIKKLYFKFFLQEPLSVELTADCVMKSLEAAPVDGHFIAKRPRKVRNCCRVIFKNPPLSDHLISLCLKYIKK